MSFLTHPSTPSPLPFSQACENNQQPILNVLSQAFAHSTHVLEIGSGTGQHSVFFAPRLPHLVWQTSDLPANHAGIAAWQQQHPSPNLRLPVTLDLQDPAWPASHTDGNAGAAIDAIFTSNTCHIVSWDLVQQLFTLAGANLPAGGVMVIYGPFNYHGQFTSESNQSFDAWLRQRDPSSGIRHQEDMMALAAQHGLTLMTDHAMPANNRTLVFRKTA